MFSTGAQKGQGLTASEIELLTSQEYVERTTHRTVQVRPAVERCHRTRLRPHRKRWLMVTYV